MTLAPAQLLKWYADIGVDEAIGDVPVDRTKLPPPEAKTAAVLPMPTPVAVPPTPIVGTFEALNDARQIAAKAQTLDELKSALENFPGLSLKRTATNIVFADGPATAKIMLIGEAPGADEDRAGRPFLGAAGQLLDKMLAAIKLSREENVYLTNIINWRPPGNRAPTDAEVALSLPFVRRHIELVNPAILVFLGGMPAKALLETTQGLPRLRGKWMDYSSEGLKNPIPSMTIFHPIYLLNSPDQKALAWTDLQAIQVKIDELGLK